MRRTTRNTIIRIIIMAVLSAAVILIALKFRPSWAESTEQRGDREIQQDYDLTLWYYDESLTPYVEQLSQDYFRKEGLRIGCELVSVVSFFENMNQLNVDGDGAPDLYITDTSRLEQAYLGSLAKENAYPDIYSLKNYSVKALTSVRYGGKQVGYPLCFDMEYFAYNKDYLDRAPQSFEKIAADSESFVKQEESPVDMVILYDINDLLFNYHFIGSVLNLGGDAGDDDSSIEINKEQGINALTAYKDFTSDLLFNYHFIGSVLNLGGDAGDDDSSIEINKEQGINALTAYKDFTSKVNISRNTTTYELAENSFVFGRSMTAILKCSSLAALNREHTNFEIAKMPAVNDAIDSKALSTTWCVCVNPMTQNTKDAEKLAKYMTFDNTNSIYDLTGFMSCKRMDYTGAGYNEVYVLYDDTTSLPKFIETEEIWKDIKLMFQNVNDGTEPQDAFNNLETSVYLQLATRTGQERQ